jgi:hypothetical protein
VHVRRLHLGRDGLTVAAARDGGEEVVTGDHQQSTCGEGRDCRGLGPQDDGQPHRHPDHVGHGEREENPA